MYIVNYMSLTVKQILNFQQILVNFPSVRFHKNNFWIYRDVTCREADREHNLSENKPKNVFPFNTLSVLPPKLQIEAQNTLF